MKNQAQIREAIKSLLPVLRSRYGVDQIGIFGSFARGEAGPDSDVDLLVSFSRPIGWDFFDLKDFLEEKLSRKVDLVTERSIRPDWKSQILEEASFLK